MINLHARNDTLLGEGTCTAWYSPSSQLHEGLDTEDGWMDGWMDSAPVAATSTASCMPLLLILLLLLLLPSCLPLHYLYGKVDPPKFIPTSPSLSLSVFLCRSESSSVLMAKEWEMMDFTMGVGMTSAPPAAPFTASASPAPTYLYGSIPPIVDELLDLSAHRHEDCFPSMEGVAPGAPTPLSEFKPLQGPNSSFDLYIPQCEEAAELEWLSKFVDDSFSDVPYYNSGLGAVTAAAAKRETTTTTPSRAEHSTSVSAVWSSLVAPTTAQNASPPSPSSSSSFEFVEKAGGADSAGKGGKGKKGGGGSSVRRCTHCASEKTPQWRTGPLGPKTLCNACGVRYKSGRLVPEYRPAASPTFVLTQHSNSHRKVMELRRQKEILLVGGRRQEGDAASAAAISELLLGDYGVC